MPVLNTDVPLRVEEHILELLLEKHEKAEDILHKFLTPCDPPVLREVDYLRDEEDIDIIQRILRGAVSRSERGVNILVSHEPGVPCAQLPRLLAVATQLWNRGDVSVARPLLALFVAAAPPDQYRSEIARIRELLEESGGSAAGLSVLREPLKRSPSRG